MSEDKPEWEYAGHQACRAEIARLRRRTHEIQELADKRYSQLVQRTEKPLEYWRSALAQADKAMKDPGVVFHSAVTRAKAADLFMQIERLQTENERLRELLTNAVLLMRPGTDLCKRTLAALGQPTRARSDP